MLRHARTLHFFSLLRKEVEKEKQGQGGLKAGPLGNPLAVQCGIALSVVGQSLLLRPRHPAYAPALVRWLSWIIDATAPCGAGTVAETIRLHS